MKKINSIFRRSVLFAVLLALCLQHTVALAAPSNRGDISVVRVFGSTRYDTAFKVADELKASLGVQKFENVVVASGTEFPDALAGSYLATQKDAPILLFRNRSTEINALKNYIKENLAAGGTVYILGGTNAIPATMESGLGSFKIKRLGGSTRYDTNLLILQEAGVGNKDILVCTGLDFADSLSASACNLPILLVKNGLTSAQKQFLATTTGNKIIVGGVNAVSATVEKQLASYGNVERLSGNTRYETSVLVANRFFTSPTAAVVAYGQNFPDGLCGGPLANAMGGPLLLTRNQNAKTTKAYVQSNAIVDGVVLGGETLISNSAATTIFGIAPGAEISDSWGKPNEENVSAVLAYADKLYAENTMTDYVNGTFSWDKPRSSNWIYFTGLMFDAFLATDAEKYSPEIINFYNQHIRSDGSIPKYLHGELDAALPGVAMVELLNSGYLSDEETVIYQKGLNYIYNQLEKQTVYPQAGNLWLHSQTSNGEPRPAWVKWNICLDGVFMSQLFLLRLTEAIDAGNVTITDSNGKTVTSDRIWDDIYSRLTFVMDNMQNPENNLLYHGYCVETGETNLASWSRGIGWYAMILVEAAEKMPDDVRREELISDFTELMDAILPYQDDSTALWYNVTDGREEYFYVKETNEGQTTIYNIPESSGSAMFAYCLLRGYHNGLLTDERYREAGLRAFNALAETRLTTEGLTDIYTSSSVTANKNLYQRNGYTTNDGKGVAPLILAAKYAN